MQLIDKFSNKIETDNVYNIVYPDILSYGYSFSSEASATEALGVTFNTYARFDNNYEYIGRKYLNFKSIDIPNDDKTIINQYNENNVGVLSGYDESVSAIKNLNYYYNLKDWNAWYYQSLDGGIGADYGYFLEPGFFHNNSSLSSLVSITSFDMIRIEYVDAIHVMNLSRKFINYSDIKIISGGMHRYVQNIYTKSLKYNFHNKLFYRNVYMRIGSIYSGDTPYSETYELYMGVLYENGVFIIHTQVPLYYYAADSGESFVSLGFGWLAHGAFDSVKAFYNFHLNSGLTSYNSSVDSDAPEEEWEQGPQFITMTSEIAITSFNISYTQTKNILQCEVKIPKDHYNYSTNNINTDGTLKKTNVYITKINIYNEKNEVIAIAKFSKPLPKNPELEYIIKFDIEL